MSVTLSQHPAAAMPDRPGAGGTGLRVQLTTGGDGAYLAVDLAAPRPVLHARCMFNPHTVAQGAVSIMRGLDEAGDEVWRITFDAVTDALACHVGDATTLSAALSRGLGWQCIELAVDTSGGIATLHVNGIERVSDDGDYSTLAARTVQLGGMLKDHDAVGELHLDEIVLADAYVGPVVVPATGEYADDPARWLVVYNREVSDSVAWAVAYRAARGVPYANLLGLSLSGDETIDAAGFIDLLDALSAYLHAHALDGQVMGVLLGYRVPGYVDAGFGVRDAIATRLHTRGGPVTVNALAADDAAPARPTTDNLGDHWLTARIDGPDLDAALRLIDEAETISDVGLGDGASSTIWLDPHTTAGGGTDPHIASMAAWADSLARQHTRLPIEVTDQGAGAGAGGFAAMSHDGFAWGWMQSAPPVGVFGSPAGRRVLSFQINPITHTAPTLRSASPSNWVEAALDAGYAAAVGSARAYSLSAVPYVRRVFEALRRGWTLAEAWYVASPLPGEAYCLVGDPLMTVAMPRAGWDVFGPVTRLDALDPAAPLAHLRESETVLPLVDDVLLDDGAPGMLVVRHVDHAGRSEAGLSLVRIAVHDSVVTSPPHMPAWPVGDDWPVRVRGGAVELHATWGMTLADAHVAEVALEASVDGGEAQSIAVVPTHPTDRAVTVAPGTPDVPTRYRWRVVTPGGLAQVTGWSRPVAARQKTNTGPTVLEVSP